MKPQLSAFLTSTFLSLFSLAACQSVDLVRWNVPAANAAGKAQDSDDNTDDNNAAGDDCQNYDADGVCEDLVTAPDSGGDSIDPTKPMVGDPTPAPLDPSQPPLVTATMRWKLAQEVIQKNCVECHIDGHHDKWKDWSEKTFVDRGKVEIGDFKNSSMIKRLSNFGGNMPKDEKALSDEDVQVLRNWIEGISKK